MYAPTLLLEAGVVAVITAVGLALTIGMVGPIRSWQDALIPGALLGFVIHMLFEFVGANTYYCKGGAACQAR